MTDDQHLHDAYDRLGTALAPPADAAQRVEATIGRRRRRRRTAVVGLTAVVLAGAGAGAVALGSGDTPDGTVVATDTPPPPPPPAFTVTRTDGSTISFDASELTVACQGKRITLSSPSVLDDSGEALVDPFFYVEAIASAVDGRTFTLPFSGDRNQGSDQREIVVFVADSGADANEVSSDEGGAAGTVQVLKASCDPTPVLELAVDATLGSEVQQGTYTVQGAYPATS